MRIASLELNFLFIKTMGYDYLREEKKKKFCFYFIRERAILFSEKKTSLSHAVSQKLAEDYETLSWDYPFEMSFLYEFFVIRKNQGKMEGLIWMWVDDTVV